MGMGMGICGGRGIGREGFKDILIHLPNVFPLSFTFLFFLFGRETLAIYSYFLFARSSLQQANCVIFFFVKLVKRFA